jgi:hypothetical protein
MDGFGEDPIIWKNALPAGVVKKPSNRGKPSAENLRVQP